MLGFSPLGSAPIGAVVASNQAITSGTITSQPPPDGQSQRFVGTTTNATSGMYTLVGSNGGVTAGPLAFSVDANAFDFTVEGLALGDYAPTLTVTGSGGTSPVTGAAAFTILGVSGGGEIAGGSDTTAPTLTGTISASSIAASSFTMSWPTAADNVAVAGYEYRLNAGAWVNVGSATSRTVSGLVAETTYAVEVRAYDAAGNRSAPALTANITTAAASSAPLLSAGNPTMVKDLLFRVSTQLQDISPQFRAWSERELVDWLNDGQKAIAKYIPYACARVDAIRLAPGTRQSIDMIDAANVIPGDGTPAATVYGNFLNDVVRNMGADGITPGRVIKVISREILDYSNPDWHTETPTGRVDEYTFDIRTPKVFYVSPPVGSTPLWVEISYMADPALIPNAGTAEAPLYGKDGSSNEVITIDDKYTDDLVNYVLARCQFKDADYAMAPGSAASYMQLFITSINSQVQALTGNNPNLKTLPFAPQYPAAAS